MQLVRAMYDERAPLPEDDGFYTRILEDRDFVAIAPQVYFLLKQQGKLDRMPSFFVERLKKTFNENLIRNSYIQSWQKRLLHLFEDLGVDVIALKGVGFAEKYFGHPGARVTSDIDLLIRPADLVKAIEGVQQLGFTLEKEKHLTGHFHCSFATQASHFPITVELHWNILREDTASFEIGAFWRQAEAVGSYRHIKELSRSHTFYMICLHGWRHNLQSVKHFLDIIQMIHLLHDELDFPALFKEAAAHKTLKRLIRTLSIVYREFPFLDTLKPLPGKRSHLYWEYEAVRSSKGNFFKRYLDFLDYQFLSFDSFRHSFAEFVHWVRTDVFSTVRSK